MVHRLHLCADDAQRLAERLVELFGNQPEFVSQMGPVVATHLGPGALAVGSIPAEALG